MGLKIRGCLWHLEPQNQQVTVPLYNKENPRRNPQRLLLLHLQKGFQVFYKKIIDSTHEKFPWKKFQNEEKM